MAITVLVCSLILLAVGLSYRKVVQRLSLWLVKKALRRKTVSAAYGVDAFFEYSTDLCCIADFEGSFIHVNDAFTKVLGYTRDELVSRKYLEMVHPEDLESTLRELAKLNEGKLVEAFQNRYVTKDGAIVYLEWNARPVAGSKSFVCATARDITQTKLAEKKIEAERDLQKSILDGASTGILLLDNQGRIEYANARARDLLGFSFDELIGKIKHEVLKGKGQHHGCESCRALFENKSRSSYHDRYRKKDGTYLEVASSIKTLIKNGESSGSILSFEDISEKVKAESKLEELRRQAEYSSKLACLGEMAASIAHEINNPLTAVIARIEDLVADLKDPKVKLSNQEVEVGLLKVNDLCLRIGNIVRALKGIARKSDSDPLAPVSLRSVVDDSLFLCQPKLHAANIALKISGLDRDVQVCARSGELSQALVNLISNAHDAVSNTSENWINVEVQENNLSTIISVTNGGPKIQKEIADKIFEPFFTTKSAGYGTGLGLTVSKRLIERQGGSLKLNYDSTHTCFEIHLPKGFKMEAVA